MGRTVVVVDSRRCLYLGGTWLIIVRSNVFLTVQQFPTTNNNHIQQVIQKEETDNESSSRVMKQGRVKGTGIEVIDDPRVRDLVLGVAWVSYFERK